MSYPDTPDISPVWAQRRADRERLSRAIAGKPILPVRVLMPPRAGDLGRWAWYVLTLIPRLILAAVSLPFTLHNRPLGALIGLVALFGFWEVWENVVKVPLVGLENFEAMKYEQSVDINKSAGNVMYSNYRGVKEALPVIRHAFAAALFHGPTPNHAGLDGMVFRFSDVIDRETKNQQNKMDEAVAGKNFLAPSASGSSQGRRASALPLSPRRFTVSCTVPYHSVSNGQARQMLNNQPVVPNEPVSAWRSLAVGTVVRPVVDNSGAAVGISMEGAAGLLAVAGRYGPVLIAAGFGQDCLPQTGGPNP